MARTSVETVIASTTLTAGSPTVSGTISVKGCSSVLVILRCASAANFPTIAVASIIDGATDTSGETTLANHAIVSAGTLTGVDSRKGRVMVLLPSQDSGSTFGLTGEALASDKIKITATRAVADATLSVDVIRNYHNHG